MFGSEVIYIRWNGSGIANLFIGHPQFYSGEINNQRIAFDGKHTSRTGIPASRYTSNLTPEARYSCY